MLRGNLFWIAAIGCGIQAPAWADTASVLSRFEGYTIVAVKTIDSSWSEKSGKKDGFEGCEYGRVIIFRDNTSVTCMSYGYQYAYGASAIILGKQVTYQGKSMTLLKMIVGDETYDVSGR